jgi:phosphonate transport system substrate-binding protein
MLNRRHLLLSTAGAAALVVTPALAQADWRQRFPEIVFAVVPAENATGVTERFQPFVAFLARELGVRVTLRIANDYAAVVEGQRAGNIHIAYYGPSSFARALMTGAQITAVAQDVNADGSTGYFSVFYVRRDSTFQNIQDLRGRRLALVDPNSTSGNNVPRFALDKMGINPEQFFANVIYSGSHENAVIALQQGSVDVAANWWNNEQESNLLRMSRRNMVRAEDFRIVFRSDEIVNSPHAVLNAMGADAIRLVQQAYLTVHEKDAEAFRRMTDGQARPFRVIDNAAYQPIVDLNRFVDNLRRRGS